MKIDCGEKETEGRRLTIKLSKSIDVDKGDGNHCDFVPIIIVVARRGCARPLVANEKCHVDVLSLHFRFRIN